MPDDAVIELLAASLHDTWIDWSKAVASEEHISKERLAKWIKCWVPYNELPEEIKQKDREIAMKYLELMA